MLAAAAGVWFVGRRELDITPTAAGILVAVVALVAVVYLALLLGKDGRVATLFLPMGIVVILLTTVYTLFPALGQREALRDLLLSVKQAAQPDERLIFYVNSDHSIDFYAPALPLRDAASDLQTVFSNAEIQGALGTQPSLLVLSPQRWASGVANASLVLTDQRRLRCSPGCNWVLLRVTRPSAATPQ